MNAGSEKSFISQELRLRIVSALVLALLALLMTWIGGQTYLLLWAVISFLIYYEFSRISAASMPFSTTVLGAGFLVLIVATNAIGNEPASHLILVAGCLGICALEFVLNRTVWSATGLVYAALPFLAFSELRGSVADGLLLTLIVFAIVWGADILAYFAGRLIGGPKLAPIVSPNKTWAGFFGGLAGSIALAGAIVFIFGKSVAHGFWLFVVCTSVVSQLGDLAESFVKRRFDVKDSGTIIPGHGGVLDRIDGLIFAGVFVWAILLIVGWFQDVDSVLPIVFSDFFLLP